MGLVLALLAVAFVGVVAHANRMLYGRPPAGVSSGEEAPWQLFPLTLCLAALLVLGFIVPPPLASLLGQIAEIVGP